MFDLGTFFSMLFLLLTSTIKDTGVPRTTSKDKGLLAGEMRKNGKNPERKLLISFTWIFFNS